MGDWHNQRRKQRRESGLCTKCGQPFASSGNLMCLGCQLQGRIDAAKTRLPYRKRNKDLAFNAYGGYKCSCCKETIELFLTIDLVDNSAGGHKATTGSGQAFYLWLKKNKYPSGYRVLCFNCNCGRQRNNGVCPHAN